VPQEISHHIETLLGDLLFLYLNLSQTLTGTPPQALHHRFRKDSRTGSITISGHEEIENRLIDCKPENKKEYQYTQ
jgi:hypothetical protein